MALFIWLFSVRGEAFLVSIPVAVNYIIAEEAVFLVSPPESVTVSFEADGLSMLGFQLLGRAKDLSVKVDLSGLPSDNPGVTTRIVFDGTHLEDSPLGVTASGFTPASADISLDRIHYRILPVAVVSEPTPSRYMSVHLRQPTVRISGPASLLSRMDSVRTSTASSSIRMDQQVALELPEGIQADGATAVARLRNPVPVVPGIRRAY